eukprot:15467714-Alexandrium_andersonii.AAC.1
MSGCYMCVGAAHALTRCLIAIPAECRVQFAQPHAQACKHAHDSTFSLVIMPLHACEESANIRARGR